MGGSPAVYTKNMAPLIDLIVGEVRRRVNCAEFVVGKLRNGLFTGV